MAQQIINTGILPNDGSGDTLLSAGGKINSNFSELYTGIKTNNENISFAGIYPNQKFPSAYVISASSSGYIDLYTTPSNRKALVLDYLITNSSSNSITYIPSLKISGVYYFIGNSITENSQGIGHNYGTSSNQKSQPIVLNAGESISLNISNTGISCWTNIIEFDASSPISRADIRTWVSGDNTLITVPNGKTVSFGCLGTSPGNVPTVNLNGICYNNSCGSTRVLGGINIVPSGSSSSIYNRLAGSNTIFNLNGFSKFHHGNIGAGDSVTLNSDGNQTGQFAWCNYQFV